MKDKLITTGRDDQCVFVTLCGEFDVRCRKALEDTLRGCLTYGGPTLVDLSGVTFMDSWCVWELAVHYQLGGGRMILCDPSQDVLISVTACDLEEWLDFERVADREPPPGDTAADTPRRSAPKR